MSAVVLEAALDAHAAGLCVLPLKAGSKAPDVTRWTGWQKERPDVAQLHAWFDPGRPGLGVVCGAVSGGLEMVELEGRAVEAGILDDLFTAAEQKGLLGLVDRVVDGYAEQTPSGGIHWLYRADGIAGNKRLASRPGPDGPEVLIETRGEGGFCVIAPTGGACHPSGRPWTLDTGGVDQIVTLTAGERHQFHQLCATLDRHPSAPRSARPNPRPAPWPADTTRPGDAYNASTSWDDLLGRHGWTRLNDRGTIQHWRRPGKDQGLSATVNANGTDRLVVHSTSTLFAPSPESYDRFGAYALLEHGGDLAAAAAHLRHQHGPASSSSGPAGRPPQPPADPPAGGGEPPELPCVQVNNRPLADVTADLNRHLLAANRPPVLYRRGGRLTWVRVDEQRPIVEAVDVDRVRHRLGHVCHIGKVTKEGVWSHVACPVDHAMQVLVAPDPAYPQLEGVVETPVVRPDGTIHQEPGYDPATRLLHLPKPDLHIPPVADQPTVGDVARAVAHVAELLQDFPFEQAADRANAIGLLLTPIIRPAISGTVPLALLTSSEPGTGKGLLANSIATVHTGRPAAARPLADDEAEIRKAITSILLEAPVFVVFDNLEDAIRSPNIAALLTLEEWSDRILGASTTVQLANRATWVATGNNLTVGGDLARRTYQVRLDAHTARPWARTGFHHPDLLDWAAQHRHELLWALLTLCRAWWAAGRPPSPTERQLGGFTPWSHTVGGILHHAGIPGFLDNLDQVHAAADTDADTWEAFISALIDTFKTATFTAADIADEANREWSQLKAVLPANLADYIGRPGLPIRIAKALAKRAGRRHGDGELVVESAGKDRTKVTQWIATSHRITTDSDGPGVEAPDTTRDSAGSAGSSTTRADEDLFGAVEPPPPGAGNAGSWADPE